jgi:pimeloyl-ACP methyl ester carboxylesterase
MDTAIEFGFIETNRVRLHVAEAGPADGPLVVLLHGFPEFWYGWRHQIVALAAAGYRVLAPDQRGYHLSDKPRGRDAYAIDRLAADVIGLIAARGRDSAAVVGHDWGAGVAWWLALRHPSWLDRLAILNVPHPAVMLRRLRRDPAQWLRSWYILAFQLPWLPEALLRANGYKAMASAMRRTARTGSFSETDLARYRAAWSKPGALTAMIDWYRAAVRRPPLPPGSPRVVVPTLVLWGARDIALARAMSPESVAYCDQGRLELFEEATHWVQHDAAERVNALLLSFLAEGRSQPARRRA